MGAVLSLGTLGPAFAAAPRPQPELYRELQEGRIGLQRVEGRIGEAKAAFLDVPISRAVVSLALAKMSFDTASLQLIVNNSPEDARTWLTRGDRYLREAAMSLIPSRGAEVRAMLLDAGSLPKTEVAMIALVEKLHGAHFNVLLPEVYRRGFTIYPSGLTDRDPDFRGAPDLLKIMVREAHKRGIEVHPWIWTFRAVSPGYGNPLLARLPGLASRTIGKDARFFSAASPQAREYVYAIVEELAEHYDIDGLLLDYVRYDEEIPEDETSKTQFALEYQARYGKFPPDPIPPNSALMVEWQLWREQQVNLAVQEISRMLKARRPHFPIGAAIFRGESYSRLRKMQHWRHWSNNHWIDWAAPMLYTAKTEELSTWLDWETDRHTRTNLLYPILGVHRFASTDNLVQQVESINSENQPGLMVFALAHFDMALLDDLRTGPFREPATLPHRNLIRAARKTLSQAAFYLTRVFGQGDFEAAATAHMLHQELISITLHLPLHEWPYWQNEALIERLKGVQHLADVAPWPAPARREFDHRLDYAITLIRANKFQLDATRYVPSSLPPIRVDDDQRRAVPE